MPRLNSETREEVLFPVIFLQLLFNYFLIISYNCSLCSYCMRHTKLDIYRQEHKLTVFLYYEVRATRKGQKKMHSVEQTAHLPAIASILCFMYDLLWEIVLFFTTSVVYYWGEEWCIVLWIIYLFIIIFQAMWLWCQTEKFGKYMTQIQSLWLFSPPPSSQSITWCKTSSQLSSALNQHTVLREHSKKQNAEKKNHITISPFSILHHLIYFYTLLFIIWQLFYFFLFFFFYQSTLKNRLTGLVFLFVWLIFFYFSLLRKLHLVILIKNILGTPVQS